MPHIRIRALSETVIQKLSAELPQELAKMLQAFLDFYCVTQVVPSEEPSF